MIKIENIDNIGEQLKACVVGDTILVPFEMRDEFYLMAQNLGWSLVLKGSNENIGALYTVKKCPNIEDIEDMNRRRLNMQNLQKCPDQIVGEFNNLKLVGENKKENRKEITKLYLDKRPIIMCIVLESPHIDEFDKYGNPIGPAMGDAGDRFFEHFESIIEKSIIHPKLNGNYDIIFANPVQIQASEGKELKSYENKLNRDNNWLTAWDDGGRKDFINRLTKYKPEVIINLCTMGEKNNLQSSVERAIDKYLTATIKAVRTHGYHPCTWLGKAPPKQWGKDRFIV